MRERKRGDFRLMVVYTEFSLMVLVMFENLLKMNRNIKQIYPRSNKHRHAQHTHTLNARVCLLVQLHSLHMRWRACVCVYDKMRESKAS